MIHTLEHLPETYALIIATIGGISAVIVALEKANKKKRRTRRRKASRR